MSLRIEVACTPYCESAARIDFAYALSSVPDVSRIESSVKAGWHSVCAYVAQETISVAKAPCTV